MMMDTTVLLVRHAAPVLPVAGDPPHVDNERPLTGEGRRTAGDLARRIARLPIAAIYSSPCRRALETVEPLAAELKLEIRFREDLAERWLADRILPDHEWLDVFRRTWEDIDFCPQGGESRRTTQDRALAALQDLRLKHRGETVVGSTHGGLLGCLLLALDGKLRFEDALSMPTPAVFSLKHRNDRWHRSSPPISLLPSNS
jgi:2,3-bisphosphoglycerate-dependent phosphoglycerate mutase